MGEEKPEIYSLANVIKNTSMQFLKNTHKKEIHHSFLHFHAAGLFLKQVQVKVIWPIDVTVPLLTLSISRCTTYFYANGQKLKLHKFPCCFMKCGWFFIFQLHSEPPFTVTGMLNAFLKGTMALRLWKVQGSSALGWLRKLPPILK